MKNTFLAVMAAALFSLSPVAQAKCANCKDGHGEQAKKAKGAKGEKHAHGENCECCKGKEKDGKGHAHGKDDKREPSSSVIKVRGDAAKLIYEGLPGAADQLAKVVLGKEGDLICYKKEDAYHCSVRGEDEESGRFEGAHAKAVFEQIPSDNEYEDGPGLAREAAAKCTLKNGKTYICVLE